MADEAAEYPCCCPAQWATRETDFRAGVLTILCNTFQSMTGVEGATPLVAGALAAPASTDVNAFTNSASTAQEASRIVKIEPGRLYRLHVSSSAAQYIQIYDADTLPADGVVPALVWAIGANGHLDISFGERGRYFANGIIIANSSTLHTKTIGSATTLFDVQYA